MSFVSSTIVVSLGPKRSLRRSGREDHIRRVLRRYLDRVRVCRAGDGESRTIARGKLAAAGRSELAAGDGSALAIACTADADAIKIAPQHPTNVVFTP